VPASRILAVTFTNKAAREMRERIEKLLSGSNDAAGLVMGTFHSLGVRFLRQNPGIVADRLGLLPNFLIYDDADQLELVKRSLISVNLDPKSYAPRRMLSRISQAKGLLISPDEFEREHLLTYDDEVVLRVYRAYQQALRKANAVDFDDLLSLPIQLFDAAPKLLESYQERYQHVMVDEYQDTNRVQYVLVTALSAKHRNLFVVGDPDQSIYGWRQADIRNILDFQNDFPDAKVVRLETNYRSTRRIVETADRVIRENTQRIERKLRTDNEDGERVAVRELADQNHEAQFIVDEARRLIRMRRITGDDIAVMYRTTAQSRVLEEAFRTSEVPYRIVGGVRFYDRREVKDVLAVLRLLYNPSDEVSLSRVIDNLPIGRGFGPKALDVVRSWATENGAPVLNGFLALAPSLAAAKNEPPLTGTARSSASKIGTVFSQLQSRLQDRPLSELFDDVVELTGYRASFDNQVEEEMQRWANVLELRSDLAKYDDVAPEDALFQYLEQVALVSDADTMEDDGRGRVTLITLHSAKGLEFPVVFISGVEEGLLPISRAVEAEFTDPAPLEEERRLFYVGITRAEKLLYMTYTGARMSYGKYAPAVASRFLSSLPESNVNSLGSRQSLTASVRRGASSPMPSTSYERTQTVVAAPKAPARTFIAGERVFHPKFGEGKISSVAERAGDQEIAVEFTRHGLKRLLGSLANLEAIEENG
jgi:DNA helicase-2/ATP-dependent DNA helicase PcrA